MFDDDLKYPYQIMGFTVPERGKYICNKCGKEFPSGIITLSTHWNKCTDGNRTINALKGLREEKGSELTIDDLDNILP